MFEFQVNDASTPQLARIKKLKFIAEKDKAKRYGLFLRILIFIIFR